MKKICKQCGKEFKPCHKTSEFCSKSCATKYRNDQKMKDGTHNFYNLDRSKIALDKVKNGTHPFLAGNMSEDALKRKAEGISKARKREAENHTHPWQNPKNFIENEYSRSINTGEARGLDIISMYVSDTEYPNTFKIGWTYDISIREKDNRTYSIHNLQLIKTGNYRDIIFLEKQVKLKYFKEEYYKKYKSTEIFPIELKDEILDFINNS